MTAPKLRFKEFKEDWDINRLGDSFSLFSGYAFPSTASSDKGVRWLKIADVGIQEMTPNNTSFLPEEYLEKYPQFIVDKNDYVIALTRPILNKKLKISKVGEKYHGALLNQRVAKIVSKNNNLNFIYSLLQKSKTVEELENSISGTDPPNLSLNDVKDIRLGFPSIEEQTKIASFLSAVDEKISQLTQKHELLSQYKQGMMQKLFSQQLRFKADDGSEFGDWEKSSIGQVTELVSRRNKNDIDAEIYSVTNSQGFVKQNEYFEDRRIAGEDTSAYKIIKFNEFAYNPARINVGSIALFDKAEVGIISSLYVCFSVSKKISIRFLEYFLKLDETIKNYGLYGEGGVRIYLWYPLFSKIPFDFPCLEEQTKIANFLSAIDQKIEVVAQQIEQAKTWKKGLLQQMFV